MLLFWIWVEGKMSGYRTLLFCIFHVRNLKMKFEAANMKKTVDYIPLSRSKNNPIVNISQITPPHLPQTVTRTRLLERLRQNQDKETHLDSG